MHTPSPAKASIFGFDLQAAEGTGDDTGIVWCPFSDASNWGPKGAPGTMDQADTVHQPNVVYPAANWWEGDIPVTFRPVVGFLNLFFGTGGALNSASRDAYNLAPCLSVFDVDLVGGTQRVRAVRDCRVATWVLRWAKGTEEYVRFSAMIRGKTTFNTSETPSGTFGAPYALKEALVDTDLAGAGAYSQSYNFEEVEIAGDEHLVDVADGMRSGAGAYPYRLPNEGDQTVNITVTRDLVDSTMYDLYMAQRANDSVDSSYAAKLRFRFVSGGVTCTLEAARCKIAEYSADKPGSKVGLMSERIVFEALASADGATPSLQASAS